MTGVQFVTDAKGRKVAVLIDLDIFYRRLRGAPEPAVSVSKGSSFFWANLGTGYSFPGFSKTGRDLGHGLRTWPPARVLQFWHMSHTLTIRLPDELLDWLQETSRRTGIPVGRLIREQLETSRAKGGKQRFLRHAGAIAGGPPDVASRKGFSRS